MMLMMAARSPRPDKSTRLQSHPQKHHITVLLCSRTGGKQNLCQQSAPKDSLMLLLNARGWTLRVVYALITLVRVYDVHPAVDHVRHQKLWWCMHASCDFTWNSSQKINIVCVWGRMAGVIEVDLLILG